MGGLVGGCVYQGASMLMKKLRIDAVAVHGACGVWGLIALGFFGNPADGMGGNGAFYGGDQLLTQVFSTLAIIAWVGALSLLIFLPLKYLGALRMGDEFQDKGADVMEHSPPKAYAEQAKVAESEVLRVGAVVA